MSRRRPEVADVIRSCETAFLASHPTSPEQRKALRDITACRTAALGGHVHRCSQCDHQEISYNSCRNRHCNKCQAANQAQWLEARAQELLPVPYFHVVFTLPEALRPLALQNQETVYAILFCAVSHSLQTIAGDSRHLGAHIGFLALLHTWGQNLIHHPHVHCIVPGGGLSADESRWIPSRPHFLLPVRVLSRFFRRTFLRLLQQARRTGKLAFQGKLEPLAHPEHWDALLSQLRQNDWTVYCKPPLGGPQQVLKYLARYTHRVAISNRRLLSLEDAQVSFRCKDYHRGGRTRILTLQAQEFVRRLLLHVLPKGFVRIRSFGFLSNRYRKEKLALCRRLLEAPHSKPQPEIAVIAPAPDSDAHICPVCHLGRMLRVETLPPSPPRIEEKIRSP